MSVLQDIPSPAVLWRWLRQWRKKQLVEPTDRVAVLTHVDEAGAPGPRYVFMTLMSVGIATLGLLQNSAAVIIGAMLIAPLMGPIIELGMGLATFDFRTVRSALKTMAVGIAFALAMAMLIVWLSPLQQATPEILARTQPTFFDLLVAVFSGLAGAYATITRKGEAIVGVAIATALMPPLAVVAYGLVLANWSIAGGAALLLTTNLLAISLSVTVVARLYGFGGSDSPKQTAWQAALIVGALALLSIPLGLSLRHIAQQTQAELAIRSVLDREASQINGRISALRVDMEGEGLKVDAVLMTPRYVEGLDKRLATVLREQLGREVDVQLREVITAENADPGNQRATLAELGQSIAALKEAQNGRDERRQNEQDARRKVMEAVLARFGTLETSGDGARLQLRLAPDNPLSLEQARALERELATALAEDDATAIDVIPPLQRLQPVRWQLDDEGRLAPSPARQLDAQLWALRRWQVGAIDVVAMGGSLPDARRRAEDVATLARNEGLAVNQARNADAAERRGAGVEGDAVWLQLPAER